MVMCLYFSKLYSMAMVEGTFFIYYKLFEGCTCINVKTEMNMLLLAVA